MDIKISVIVPVYNVEDYLIECLDSIVTQNFDAFEIICVEDCSTDSSKEILLQYEKKYDNIKTIFNPLNGGLSYSRNVGTRAAIGKYVLYVDSDDILKQNALSELYIRAEAKKTDILFFDFTPFESTAPALQPVQTINRYKNFEGVRSGKEFFYITNFHGIFKAQAWAQLIKLDFIRNNKLSFHEQIVHEDILFSFECLMKAGRVAGLNRHLYCYRKRNFSITSKPSIINKKSTAVIFSEIFNYWKNNPANDETNTAIKLYLRDVVVRLFANTNVNDTKNDNFVFDNAADEFIYELLLECEKKLSFYINITSKKWQQIMNARQIYVFGAGAYGRETIKTLKDKGITPAAVVVSNTKGIAENLCDIKIMGVEMLPPSDDALIIVAVGPPLAREVIQIIVARTNYDYLLPYDEERIMWFEK